MRRSAFLTLFAAAVWPVLASAQALTREQAEKSRDQLARGVLDALKSERAAEMSAKSISLGDKTLRWVEREFGSAPVGKRSMWISLHGGGNGPAAMNDQQWQNQIRLYQPEEGIYLAPRAPTDAWNMWHEAMWTRFSTG